MSRTPWRARYFGDRDGPGLRHAGRDRADVAHDEHVPGGEAEAVVVERCLCFLERVEDVRDALVDHEVRGRGGGLDHGPLRGQRSAQRDQRAWRLERVVDAVDGVLPLLRSSGGRELFPQRLPGDGEHVQVEGALECLEEGGHAAVAVHVGQVARSGGLAVDEYGYLLCDLVEVIEVDAESQAAGDRGEMDDRVGRPGDGGQDDDRVPERPPRS
jgi:hypothetical protein